MASNLLNPKSITNNLLVNNQRRYEMIAARVEGVSSKTMFMMLFLIIKSCFLTIADVERNVKRSVLLGP